ncbi:KdsC family phosphatase [Acanthopleuribacter pedis]|uniref:HAD hydrolase family protein n=1 Tax=Acanthopleuribacter pedis TaxID=442870 RepID=A0A8J7U2X9_9BACT|nr:HAD hydrolase family protein [Acanthopleuribacter pedis]MBO1319788.1 HAD hydrolase family protein [Acanthopleuribacter pedis]
MNLGRFKQIKAIISDVDGILTDGSIVVTEQGESKTFSVRDGMAIALWRKCGFKFALLSGRLSAPVTKRAEELGLEAVKTGRLDKETAFNEILEEIGLSADEVAYIGDDLPDLAPIQLAKLGFCPQDGAPEVQEAADYVVPVDGGRGVVRHIIERILKEQGLWSAVVKHHYAKAHQ